MPNKVACLHQASQPVRTLLDERQRTIDYCIQLYKEVFYESMTASETKVASCRQSIKNSDELRGLRAASYQEMEYAKFSTVVMTNEEISYLDKILPTVPIWTLIEAAKREGDKPDAYYCCRLFDLLANAVTSMYTMEVSDFDPDALLTSRSELSLISRLVLLDCKYAWDDDFYGKKFGQVSASVFLIKDQNFHRDGLHNR